MNPEARESKRGEPRYKLGAELANHVTAESAVRALVTNNPEARYCLDAGGGTLTAGSWYEHEKDMIALSLSYPHLLFTLDGEGEESGDVWRKYFCAGKMQLERATIQIAPFDPKKLR